MSSLHFCFCFRVQFSYLPRFSFSLSFFVFQIEERTGNWTPIQVGVPPNHASQRIALAALHIRFPRKDPDDELHSSQVETSGRHNMLLFRRLLERGDERNTPKDWRSTPRRQNGEGETKPRKCTGTSLSVALLAACLAPHKTLFSSFSFWFLFSFFPLQISSFRRLNSFKLFGFAQKFQIT